MDPLLLVLIGSAAWYLFSRSGSQKAVVVTKPATPASTSQPVKPAVTVAKPVAAGTTRVNSAPRDVTFSRPGGSTAQPKPTWTTVSKPTVQEDEDEDAWDQSE
jgi:hypothetical protein